MTERLIIAGSGGQGVMLLGKILAEACMREGKFVTWLPSYGAEVRGGTSHAMVVISDKEIGSPYVGVADSLIIMNSPSLEKFKNRLRTGGLLVLNSSLAPKYSRREEVIRECPFTDMALGLGNIRVANMIALGCYIALKKVVSAKTVFRVIEDIAPADKKGLIGINKKALEQGVGLK